MFGRKQGEEIQIIANNIFLESFLMEKKINFHYFDEEKIPSFMS
jgi:uncharacterized protein YacL (UPF0231 family)